MRRGFLIMVSTAIPPVYWNEKTPPKFCRDFCH
jgi:hypothetical protein